ncbi:hypothetical protein QP994_01350 [Corynebacterium sp. MSK044]|uniref:hypothetical protein n=1 Tax=unclassified Corynebacterium TaxID=2624378 RepID=UPI00254B79DB|nr:MULTISPECIES: hypothetical protein [unclassified Corynebacterium]MDK8794101.1 hypothetical protein [Corynebacterium sp. MSK041]MDK8796532.1 hypothetical protein [Corynebacterium sp. MSK044]
MKALYLIVAALGSIVAIAGVYLDFPRVINIAAVALAAVGLVLWLAKNYASMESAPIELDEEQRGVIEEMKADGDVDKAARQIQLWFRNVSYGEAATVVREL